MNGKLINKFKIDNDYPMDACCINKDGTKIVIYDLVTGLKVWDLNTGECLTLITKDFTYGLCFSPDSSKVAFVVSNDNTIRIWDLVSNTVKSVEGNDRIDNLKFSHDSRTLVGIDHNGHQIKIITFDAKTMTIIAQQTQLSHTDPYQPNLTIASNDARGCAYARNYLYIYGLENAVRSYKSNPAVSYKQVQFIENNTKLLVIVNMQQENEKRAVIYNLANQEVQNYLYKYLSLDAADLLKEADECYINKQVLDLSDNQKKEIFNHLPGRLKETIRGTIEIDEIGNIDSFIDNLDEALQVYAQSEKEDQKKNLKRPYPE